MNRKKEIEKLMIDRNLMGARIKIIEKKIDDLISAFMKTGLIETKNKLSISTTCNQLNYNLVEGTYFDNTERRFLELEKTVMGSYRILRKDIKNTTDKLVRAEI